MQITISAEAVAWYGAIVATTSAILGAISVFRDRAKIRVSATPDMKIVQSVGDYSKDSSYILIEVANVGRRTVHLRELPYLTLKGEKRTSLIVKGPWQPSSILAEGESATMLGRQQDVDLSQIRRVIVTDATGRRWKGKVRKG